MCTRMWARGNKKEFFSFVMAKALKFISLIKFYFMEVRGGLGNIFLWENSNFKFFYWSWHNFWYATSIKKRGFNVITKLFFPSFVEKLFSISLNHDGWWCKIFTHISAIQNRRCFFHRNFFLLIVISLIVPIIIKINNDVTLLRVRWHVEFSWYGTWKYFYIAWQIEVLPKNFKEKNEENEKKLTGKSQCRTLLNFSNKNLD